MASLSPSPSPSPLSTSPPLSPSEYRRAGKYRDVGRIEGAAKLAVFGGLSIPLLSAACLCALPPLPLSRSLSLYIRDQWCSLSLSLFGIDVEIVRADQANESEEERVEEREGGTLIVHLNQASLIETLCILKSQPIRKLQKKVFIFANFEYLLIPLYGWLTYFLGAQLVVRQWPEQAREALEKTKTRVKNGESVYMSVEGRRSPDGALQPYKRGAAVLAIATQAPIVPIVMHGPREILPFGSWRINPGLVRIVALPMIHTKGLTHDDRAGLTQRLRQLAEHELHQESHRARL